MTNLILYNPFQQLSFIHKNCFLCGQPVNPTEVIPIFPDWLTTSYNLAHQELLLLDKSILTYAELTLPCCTNCREHHLGPLEQKVQAAATQGLAGWQQLDPKILFQWLGKIFYGLLVREINAEQDPLIKPPFLLTEDIYMLDKMQSFFKVLQSIRVPMQFADFMPCSVFIAPLQPDADSPAFEFRDDLHTMMISIKQGNTLLVSCLLDNGILKEALHRLWHPLTGKALYPKQAAEFQAQVYYAAYLLNVIPEYFVRPVKPSDDMLVLDTLIDDITASVFNPWQLSGYTQMFEEMLKRWGITATEILQDPLHPLSFIFDAAGNFKDKEPA
ncbi:hypothetical protein [Adhaeribacter pallidiroseus]|uniref:Uncharacterized protein n=1 Tax=Adhaeribacter pallidiroseus TaxID=2072847 RepID=A0A369QJN4_9BACT|nr:hypothetical protein [Adhaeribacter pallidiroseus]RDC65143.1 hypothetical protein AHMF7616_03773 [Adhaeribacter pallidiroseus]